MANDKAVQDAIRGRELSDLLHRACNERTRVKITFNKASQTFYSNMVHLYRTHLLLEGFSPPQSKDQLTEYADIEVSFAIEREGLYQFESVYQGLKGAVSDQFLIDRPDQIIHIQRRRTYRIDPNMTLTAGVISIGRARTVNKVKVENVSIDGACLSFPHQANIRVGALIKGIRLRLENEEDLILNAIVRSSYRGAGGRFCLGVEWEIMEHEQRQALSRYVNACQRKEAKRKR